MASGQWTRSDLDSVTDLGTGIYKDDFSLTRYEFNTGSWIVSWSGDATSATMSMLGGFGAGGTGSCVATNGEGSGGSNSGDNLDGRTYKSASNPGAYMLFKNGQVLTGLGFDGPPPVRAWLPQR